jgi:hypothetical protein
MIFCDNTSAIKLTKNPVHHNRAKHFYLKYQFIRNLVQKKEVELRYINIQEQLANIFTKVVAKVQFLKLRDHIVSLLSIKGEGMLVIDAGLCTFSVS